MDVLSHPDVSPLVQHITRLLARHGDPAAGVELLAAFTPDAPLVVVQPGTFLVGLATAGVVDAATFARAHESVVLERQRLGRLDTEEPALTLAALRREPDGRSVAWFDARLGGEQAWLAVGLQGEDSAPLVGWWTLWDTQQDWSYEHGRLQVLVDFGLAQRRTELLPRSWVDVGFYRLFGIETPKLLTLPDARFACHGDTSCCNVRYKIQVTPGMQAVVDAVPWETIHPELVGVKLPVLPNGMLEVKAANERCRFLDGQRRCLMHVAAGRSVFTPCTVFPFAFQGTPEGVAVTATSTCPSARSNLGPLLTDRAADLHSRLALLPSLESPKTFFLAPEHAISWEGYRDAEAVLIGFLGREELPLHRRLWLGSQYLDALRENREFDEASAPHSPRPLSGAQIVARERAIEALLEVAEMTVPKGEPAPDVGEAQTAEMRWLLQNLLFSKALGFRHDLRTAHHAAILAYAMARHVQRRTPDGLVAPYEIWNLAGFFWDQRLSELIEKQPELFGWLREDGCSAWLLGREAA